MPREFDIIKEYFQPLSTIKSNAQIPLNQGDDCAVVFESQPLVFSIDTQIAEVHFLEDMPADQIAHRGLAAALSDLAAMGVKPSFFTLALTLTGDESPQWLSNYASGLEKLAQQFSCPLVGGDTTQGKTISQTFQVHGYSENGSWVTRSGAKQNHGIYVTGPLGWGAAGLKAFLENGSDDLKQGYGYPMPKIDTGFAIKNKVSAMIDISDGLLADLMHICKASHLDAEIELSRLPLLDSVIKNWGYDSAVSMALSGGDDYQLCFTAEVSDITPELMQAHQIHRIGRMRSKNSQNPRINCLQADGSLFNPGNHGYQHF